MKKKRFKKIQNILLLLILLDISVAVTYAYFKTAESKDNNFYVGNFDVNIVENFDTNSEIVCDGVSCEDIVKEVFVSNNEDIYALVRLSFNEKVSFGVHIYDNGYEVVESSSLDLDSTGSYVKKNWTDEFINDWFYFEGWYYYKKLLPANTQVKIMNSVTPDISISGQSFAEYDLDFNIEAVQATNEAVYILWNKNVIIHEDNSVEWLF